MTPVQQRSLENLHRGHLWTRFTGSTDGPMHDAYATARVITRALNLPAFWHDSELLDGWPLDAGTLADDPALTGTRYDGVCGVLTARGHGTGATPWHFLEAALAASQADMRIGHKLAHVLETW